MLRVALLGSGFMGSVHADAWKQIGGAQVVAVAGVPLEAAQRLAQTLGADATTSLDDPIARDDVDAVDICLPTNMHEEFAVKSLQAAKHTLCEKPLALSLEATERILDAAEASGKVFMVAQVVRFWPQYKAASRIARSGDLGKVLSIRASRTSKMPDWGEWFKDPEQSGGALFDLGIHDLDYVISIMGRPASVHAIGRKSAGGAWDHVSTHLSFAGASADLETGYFLRPGYPFTTQLRLVCEEGLLEYNFRAVGNVESRDPERTALTLISGDSTASFPQVDATDAYLTEIREFVECATSGKPSELVSNTEVRLVLEVAEGIRRSLETAKQVEL